METFIEILKFFVAIYDKTTPSIRFAYIFWILFVELYVFASALEKHNNLTKPRDKWMTNYHGTHYLFGRMIIIIIHCKLYN